METKIQGWHFNVAKKIAEACEMLQSDKGTYAVSITPEDAEQIVTLCQSFAKVTVQRVSMPHGRSNRSTHVFTIFPY